MDIEQSGTSSLTLMPKLSLSRLSENGEDGNNDTYSQGSKTPNENGVFEQEEEQLEAIQGKGFLCSLASVFLNSYSVLKFFKDFAIFHEF